MIFRPDYIVYAPRTANDLDKARLLRPSFLNWLRKRLDRPDEGLGRRLAGGAKLSKARWLFRATDLERAVKAVRRATGRDVTSVIVGPTGNITVMTGTSSANEDAETPNPWDNSNASKRSS
jgi:hypothetical protein